MIASDYPRPSVLIMASVVAGLGLLLLRAHRPVSPALAVAPEPLVPRRVEPTVAAFFRVATLRAAYRSR